MAVNLTFDHEFHGGTMRMMINDEAKFIEDDLYDGLLDGYLGRDGMAYPISMDGPPLDLGLLREKLDWARAESMKPVEESAWAQGHWFVEGSVIGRTCGSASCIAGKTALDLGWNPQARHPQDSVIMFAERGGQSEEIRWIAKKAIGLTEGESRLFDSGHSMQELDWIGARIMARAGERP